MAPNLDELKDIIRDITGRLDALGPEPDAIPEFTLLANAVRRNEYLAKRHVLESELILTYARYAKVMEWTTFELVEVTRQTVELLKIHIENSL